MAHINNEEFVQENEWEIQWVIDRQPDYNIINDINTTSNLQYINNHHFNQQFHYANHTLMNGLIQFNQNEDFIPFETTPFQSIQIGTDVHEIYVSEEERDCPICFEPSEIQDITLINCGHKFCGNCITEYIRRNRIESRCPLCRVNIVHITFQTNHYNDTFLEL